MYEELLKLIEASSATEEEKKIMSDKLVAIVLDFINKDNCGR